MSTWFYGPRLACYSWSVVAAILDVSSCFVGQRFIWTVLIWPRALLDDVARFVLAWKALVNSFNASQKVIAHNLRAMPGSTASS